MFLLEAWQAVAEFVETGGRILLVLAAATFWMWLLICERTLYLFRDVQVDIDRVLLAWSEHGEGDTLRAQQIQRMLICQLRHDVNRGLWAIRTLIAICPMLGLLGTVMGMLEVFDVMAAAGGTGNIRGMASGVSQATFSTLAGMVASISGLVASVRLGHWASERTQGVAELLNDGIDADAGVSGDVVLPG